MGGGDEFGGGTRAEAGEMRRVVPGRENLQDPQTVFAVGHESEGAGGDHTNLDVVDVVELALGGEDLIELGCLRSFHVDDGESLLSCRNVRVGAGHINVAGVLEWD